MLHAAEPAFQTEVISRSFVAARAERRAHADSQVINSEANRPPGLHQRGWPLQESRSLAWAMRGKPISGSTIADLARDGMLALTTINRLASAQLTERGKWFARTLLRDAVSPDRESLLSSELASG